MDIRKELGKRIKDAREFKSTAIGRRYTGQMLADALGVSRGFIGDLESGRTPIPPETLKKIIEICGVPSDFFSVKAPVDTVNLSDAHSVSIKDVVSLPVVGTVRAGIPILAIENIDGYFPALKSMLNNNKEYFYLRVKGDSMNLEFNDGSLLLIEKTPDVENGEIAVVLINGFDATVKKVVKNNNMITLIPMSSNPEYTPQMYDIIKDQIQIIGKVKSATKIY